MAGILQAALGMVLALIGAVVRSAGYLYVMYKAYSLRIYAVLEYGRVIHEFDPWFNYRATTYLAEHGYSAFFKWFDYMSWYPLGRPIGTTIYPGMQITAVWIWKGLAMLPKAKFFVPKRVLGVALPAIAGKYKLQPSMSLNDVCVFIPAWFGSLASVFLGFLAYEASGSKWAGLSAAAVMSVLPAHMMRSVAGGFDNESVAVTALCLTFWLWCRAVRTPQSWPYGIAAGIAYVNMAAAWGGYIAVCNMIGAHTALLVAAGFYTQGLHRAYSLWYVIGTLGAMQVPVIGYAPIRSLEQVIPLAVFVVMQLLEWCDWQRRRSPMKPLQFFAFRAKVFVGVGICAALASWLLLEIGYFNPLSSRIRGLLIKHTRTGNPLVDSVSEHQPSNEQAYWTYLHYCMYVAPVGLGLLCVFWRTAGALFLLTYACVAYYFSLKMSRLMIICGPICSALTGVAIGYAIELALHQLRSAAHDVFCAEAPAEEDAAKREEPKQEEPKPGKAPRGKKRTSQPPKAASDPWPSLFAEEQPQSGLRTGGVGSIMRFASRLCWRVVDAPTRRLRRAARATHYRLRFFIAVGRVVAVGVAALVALQTLPSYAGEFLDHCDLVARSFSNPRIMFKSRGRIIDDYREGYWWLRDNTAEDARVMAWWDYGYQITGIGNRTTIADGNTWNHEHIATLGRCLTSPENKAHRMIRHLADYVLVWAGGHKDDLAKSPHMARIGNSVYSDICPGDPTCSRYGFSQSGPTPMMAASLLYKLHSHEIKPGVRANPKLFRHVFTSQNGLVRIFEVQNISTKSKAWNADPANRLCDAPGSWYCPGQYPPAFQKLIKGRRDFAQLEDFNRKKSAKSEYTKFVEGRGGEL